MSSPEANHISCAWRSMPSSSEPDRVKTFMTGARRLAAYRPEGLNPTYIGLQKNYHTKRWTHWSALSPHHTIETGSIQALDLGEDGSGSGCSPRHPSPHSCWAQE
jgi:hypothetical protein